MANPVTPASDTDKLVPDTEQIPDTGMDFKGEMPMPKRKKRNNDKRE